MVIAVLIWGFIIHSHPFQNGDHHFDMADIDESPFQYGHHHIKMGIDNIRPSISKWGSPF
jgi:hypothetical protein